MLHTFIRAEIQNLDCCLFVQPYTETDEVAIYLVRACIICKNRARTFRKGGRGISDEFLEIYRDVERNF